MAFETAAQATQMAKFAEQAERYEEMKTYMKSVVEEKKKLTTEERNLLSVAYKNVVGARRASWRVLNSIENTTKQGEWEKDLVAQYKQVVEEELTQICDEILELLRTECLTAGGLDPEEEVFYYKMRGDYFRYKAEYATGQGKVDTQDEAKGAYKKAMEAAKALQTTSPIRLGLALNFSVFHYEILQKSEEACNLAKKAFDDAVGDLEGLDEEQYKDATLIMQLLRDNLTLWDDENRGDRYVREEDMDMQEFE